MGATRMSRCAADMSVLLGRGGASHEGDEVLIELRGVEGDVHGDGLAKRRRATSAHRLRACATRPERPRTAGSSPPFADSATGFGMTTKVSALGCWTRHQGDEVAVESGGVEVDVDRLRCNIRTAGSKARSFDALRMTT